MVLEKQTQALMPPKNNGCVIQIAPEGFLRNVERFKIVQRSPSAKQIKTGG